MNWDPEQLRDDFLAAAKRGKIKISSNIICVETLPVPHTPPRDLPDEKVAVYVFCMEECILKVGQSKAKGRYAIYHYNPDSSDSNLSKSLLTDERVKRVPNLSSNLSKETVGKWIRENTNRVNFFS